MAGKRKWSKEFDIMRGTDVYYTQVKLITGQTGHIEFWKGYGRDKWEGKFFIDLNRYMGHSITAASLAEAKKAYTLLADALS